MSIVKQFKENIKLIYGKEASLNRHILNVALGLSILLPALLVWLVVALTWNNPETTEKMVGLITLYVLVYLIPSGILLWRTYKNTEHIRIAMEEQAKKKQKSPMDYKKKDELHKQRQLQKLKQNNRRRKKK